MPILIDKKLLFIHIPKTGGSYIEWEFKFNYHESSLFSTTNDRYESNGIKFHLQHLNYSTILNENFFKEKYISDFYKFTFIRNPYTRSLSEYFWRFGHSTFDPENFHEFVIRNYIDPKFDHYLPQSFYFDVKYDFIGKYETLEIDLCRLYKFLGINEEISNIKRNVSNFDKNDLIFNINRNTLDVMNELFKDDFILGNYEKI